MQLFQTRHLEDRRLPNGVSDDHVVAVIVHSFVMRPLARQGTVDSLVATHDALIVSLAEHNGSYTAAFKNLYDWTSRVQTTVWSDKHMLLLSTSPGARGGASVMAAARATFPRMGADLKAFFSLPSFGRNFSAQAGIADDSLKADFEKALAAFAA